MPHVKPGDEVRIKGSKSGRDFEVLRTAGNTALLRPVGSDKQGGFEDSMDNLIMMRRK
jgi:hypothetical protein